MDFHPGTRDTKHRQASILRVMELNPVAVSASREEVQLAFGDSFPAYRCVLSEDITEEPSSGTHSVFLDWRVLVRNMATVPRGGLYPILVRYVIPAHRVLVQVSALKDLDDVKITNQSTSHSDEQAIGFIGFAWSESELLVDLKGIPCSVLPLEAPAYGRAFERLIIDMASNSFVSIKQYTELTVEASGRNFSPENKVSLEKGIQNASTHINRFLSGI